MDDHRRGREADAVTLSAEEVEHFVLDFIRQEHPEWVRDDGTCPECLEHYVRLDEIEIAPVSRTAPVD